MKLLFYILGILCASLFTINSQSASSKRNMGTLNELDARVVKKITDLCDAKDRMALRSTCKKLKTHLQDSRRDDFVELYKDKIIQQRNDFIREYTRRYNTLRASSLTLAYYWQAAMFVPFFLGEGTSILLLAALILLPTSKRSPFIHDLRNNCEYMGRTAFVGLLATPLIAGIYAGIMALSLKKYIAANARKCYYSNDTELRNSLNTPDRFRIFNYGMNICNNAPLLRLSNRISCWTINKIFSRALRIN